MKIRNTLAAAAIFASFGGTSGLVNAPQPASASLVSVRVAEKGIQPHRMQNDDARRDSRPTGSAQRMTAAQREAHRRNSGIHFVRRNAATTVADNDASRQ